MKKFGFIFPILLFLVLSFVSSRMIASGTMGISAMALPLVVMLVVMVLMRPKKAAPQSASSLEAQCRGEFGKDAFANDPQLAAKFQAAMKDYSGNMPKAALSKLQKLAPLCTEDADVYVVSIAIATLSISQNKVKDAIREYVRALNIHPSSELAHALGSSYQRIGNLDKAIDTYEYAMDLDSNNIEAISSIATAYVADGNYNAGLEYAMKALEKNENHASALATAAICNGLLGDSLMSKHFTDRAVANGYKKDKITQTIDALKKR